MRTPRKSYLLNLLAAAALAAFSAIPAQAEVKLSTMGTVDPDYVTTIAETLSTGFAFTTDNQSYTLESITGRFSIYQSNASWNLGARIYEAASTGFPISDTPLGTFSHPVVSVGSSVDLVFTADSLITLSANSTYLFALVPLNVPVDRLEWYAAPIPTHDPVGWNVVDAIFYRDFSEPWRTVGDGEFTLMASVSVSEAIPEPTTWALLGGVCLFAAARRLRKPKA